MAERLPDTGHESGPFAQPGDDLHVPAQRVRPLFDADQSQPAATAPYGLEVEAGAVIVHCQLDVIAGPHERDAQSPRIAGLVADARSSSLRTRLFMLTPCRCRTPSYAP